MCQGVKSCSREELESALAAGDKVSAAQRFSISVKSVDRLIRQWGLPRPAYVQSLETRKLRSEAIRATLANRPEARALQLRGLAETRAALKGRHLEDVYGSDRATAIRANVAAGHTGIVQSQETRVRRREAMKGRTYTDATRALMSASRREGFKSGRIQLSPRAGCGRGGFREEIGHYVRSHYEYILAVWLKSRGVAYQYEPRVFVLTVDGGQTTYRPDFLIGSMWFEVKNTFNVTDPSFQAKVAAFRVQYPSERLIVIVGDRAWGEAHSSAAIDAVMAAQADLVDIVHTLHAVVCVKG